MRRVTAGIMGALQIVILIAILAIVLAPGGVVRVEISRWRRDRAIAGVLRSKWTSLAQGGSKLGSGAGTADIVEFADYQCPFCRAEFTAVDSVVRVQHVNVRFRHFPLSIHPAAEGAARAAICADEQGRFQDMNRRLFTTTDWEADQNWIRLASAAGVTDLTEFQACLHSVRTNRRLREDLSAARELRLRATPSFVTARQVVEGTMPASALARLARDSQ